MDNLTLRLQLIHAAQSKDFSTLMDLLDSHTPDLSHEDFIFRMADGTVTSAVAHVIGAYVAHECDCAELETVLNHGCCANSNNNVITTKMASLPVGAPLNDAYFAESRPLINAIKTGKQDMVEFLVNYSCACCNGAGANVTDKIVELAEKLKSFNPQGQAIVDFLTENLGA